MLCDCNEKRIMVLYKGIQEADRRMHEGERGKMEKREIMEQVSAMYSDNPAKFIKIRDILEDVFEGRELNSAQDMSDLEFGRLCARFRDIDVPFNLCKSKESVCQLQKAIFLHRSRARDRYEDRTAAKKSIKSRKKRIFDLFG